MTPRQPTIKTLFLITAMIAVQCATLIVEFQRHGVDRLTLLLSAVVIVMGIGFWCLWPLLVSLFMRPALVAAICFASACLATWGDDYDGIFFYVYPVTERKIALIAIYATTSYFIAKSCRVREQPGSPR
jgi:hypothetical protein